MRAGLALKQKQSFWETPRNLVLVTASVAAVFAAISGILGFKIGQGASSPPIQIIFQPGSIVATPSAAVPPPAK